MRRLQDCFPLIRMYVSDEDEKRRFYRMMRYVTRHHHEIPIPNGFYALLVFREEIRQFLQKHTTFSADETDAFLDFFWEVDPILAEKLAHRDEKHQNRTIDRVIRTGFSACLLMLGAKAVTLWWYPILCGDRA